MVLKVKSENCDEWMCDNNRNFVYFDTFKVRDQIYHPIYILDINNGKYKYNMRVQYLLERLTETTTAHKWTQEPHFMIAHFS